MEGRGYASEAVRALVQLAFGQLRANRIEIVAQVENTPSRAVAERLGFTFELVMRQQGRNARNNSPVDLAFYSLIRPEYEARQDDFRGPR
jgi:ribosomal-protein-serine acetyltransferase